MFICPSYVSTISPTENIGDSLIKINNNFYNLKEEFTRLKRKVDNTVQIRTFFYYGPNAETDSNSGMQNGVNSRPSNTTIENFINDPAQLNVPAISKINDRVYVIYQKTGYLQNSSTRETESSTDVNVNGEIRNVPFSTTTPEIYNTYSPVFIIWLLTYDGTKYVVAEDFPKYSQAETISSPLWNDPLSWAEF
jgi:hypothetical protein